MKKLLVTLMACLPFMAMAHQSVVQCESYGRAGKVTLTISSEDGLLADQGRIVIHSQGIMFLEYVFDAKRLEAENEDEVKFSIQSVELEPDALPLPDDQKSFIDAILTLKKKDINIADGPMNVAVPLGTGKIEVLKSVNQFPALFPEYSLESCKGLL